jgi:hypothetical protein
MEYIPPELDESSRQAIDAINKRVLNSSADTIAAENLENVGDSGGMLQAAPKVQAYDPEGSGAMLQAIQQKAQNKYQADLGRIKSQVKQRSQRDIVDRRSRAMNLVAKEQAYNEQVRQAKAMAEQQKKQARAATLGSILGIGGAVLGGVLGSAGGPMGAAAGAGAGMQIGSGLGGMAGG